MGGALALHYLNGSVRVKPSWIGKTATVLQMIAIAACMLQLNLFQREFVIGTLRLHVGFLDIPVYLAGVATLVSGAGYVLDGIRQLHDKGHADAKPASEI